MKNPRQDDDEKHESTPNKTYTRSTTSTPDRIQLMVHSMCEQAFDFNEDDEHYYDDDDKNTSNDDGIRRREDPNIMSTSNCDENASCRNRNTNKNDAKSTANKNHQCCSSNRHHPLMSATSIAITNNTNNKYPSSNIDVKRNTKQ